MIPCTIRSSLLFGKVLKRTLPKQGVTLSKYYTTDSSHNSDDNDNNDRDVKLNTEHNEEPPTEKKAHFWEIPEHPRSTIETNKSVKSRSEKTSTDTRDFRELLDTLFDRKPIKPLPKPTNRNRDADSVIEKKLLDLVIRKRQLYKEKAPLPRAMMAPIYGTTANKVKQNQHDEDDHDYEGGLDFLNPSDKPTTTNWDMKNIAQNKRIMLKDQEMKAIDTIVQTKTSLELLECVNKEIDQQVYPKYYPSVLAAAIEHASRKDPYLALTIFELAKSKSMESYILGCTTKVYDAMLLLRWETWRDVYGMLNLVEEMTVNGIQYSNNSRRIVRSVVQEIEAEGNDLDQEEIMNGEELQSESLKGIYWNADEKRACNVMKEMVGKWIINK